MPLVLTTRDRSPRPPFGIAALGGFRVWAFAALFASLALLGGCASARPIEAFRQDMANYIAVQGHGDPNCLRDTVDLRSRRSPRPSAIRFGSMNNSGSRDAVGILVGIREVDHRPWYVFLVGVTTNNARRGAKLETVKAMAFTADGEGLHWVTGNVDEGAEWRYRSLRGRSSVGVATYADNNAPWNELFPASTDVFLMDGIGGDIEVFEQGSGASWHLRIPKRLPPPSGTAPPPVMTAAR